jgi:hypothetical protein
MKNLLAPLALLALAPVSIAHAESITYGAGLGNQPAGARTTLTVPAFDRSLGELQRVEIDVWTDISGKIGVENRGKAEALMQLDLDGQASVRLPGQRVPSLKRSKAKAELLLPPFDHQLDLAGESGFTLAPSMSFEQNFVIESGMGAYMNTKGEKEAVVEIQVGARAGLTVTCNQRYMEDHAFEVAYRVRVIYVFAKSPRGHDTTLGLRPTRAPLTDALLAGRRLAPKHK